MRDVEGAVPYTFVSIVCLPQNRCRSLRILPSAGNNKSGAELVLRYLLCLRRKFVFLLFPICTACRLAPIEALPQAPQWALPLDPTSPLASGLSLRFIARFARCLLCFALVSYSVWLCHSSFLIPHSSFFSHRIPIPVQQFYNLIIIKSFYSMIVCTLRIGINSHGTSMAYLLKRILHDRYH